MNIINKHSLLSSEEIRLLNTKCSQDFQIGRYKSLDGILTRLKVNVLIEPGVVKHSIPKALDDAERFWSNEVERLESLEDKESAMAYKNANENLGKIRREKDCLSSMYLRGFYDPVDNVIKLYPEEMIREYNGTRMDELLVSTLAHETMHAYFDRPRHKRFPYVVHVEEPLAEFGMLLFLNETGIGYYNWAYQDVNAKKTCYRYGAMLMDQYSNGDASLRKYLENYKINLVGYPMPAVNSVGGTNSISMPTKGVVPPVQVGGTIINPTWQNVFKYPPRCFYDRRTDTLGLDGDWTEDRIRHQTLGDVDMDVNLHIGFHRESYNNIHLGANFSADYHSRVHHLIRQNNIGGVVRRPAWHNVFKNPPRYFYDRKTDTLGFDGDWSLYCNVMHRRECEDLFHEMKFDIDFGISVSVKHVYLGAHFDAESPRILSGVFRKLVDPFIFTVSPANHKFYAKKGLPFLQNGNKPFLSSCGDGLYVLRGNDKKGMVDDQLNLKLPYKYDLIFDFGNDGLCEVGLETANGYRYGFINSQFEEQIPVDYEDIKRFENGITVAKKNGFYGVINDQNQVIHPFDLNYRLIRFVNGYAAFEDENGKWGAIGSNGDVVIPCVYDSYFSFDNGVARVKQDGREFMIDKNGNKI